MAWTTSNILLALFGLSLILVTLSLLLLRGTAPGHQPPNFAARFFLIALRLAIGWHCFVEGMEKVSTPNWSSEAYLRESIGPLAPYCRDMAGDRLIVAGTNEDALAVSPYTGEILGRQTLSGAAALGPIAASGTILIVTNAGRLIALR